MPENITFYLEVIRSNSVHKVLDVKLYIKAHEFVKLF